MFGAKKVTLNMQKFSFVPGENVTGEVVIKLKKPTKARQLTIRLMAHEHIKKKSGIAQLAVSNSRSTEHETKKVFDMSIPLGGEMEYSEGKYPFSIPIPTDISAMKESEEKAGKAIGILAGTTTSNIEWTVKANLDIPMALDASAEQKIVVN